MQHDSNFGDSSSDGEYFDAQEEIYIKCEETKSPSPIADRALVP